MKFNDYISPRMELNDLKLEGVLCASGDTESDPIFDLDDYNPSAGNWGN